MTGAVLNLKSSAAAPDEDGADNNGRVCQQYRQKSPRVAYVLDQKKNPPHQVHQQHEDDERDDAVNEPPFVKARIGHRRPVQEDLIQEHVQEDADVTEQVGARVAQEHGLGLVLRRRKVSEDQNRLDDVVDEAGHENYAAAFSAEVGVREQV